MFSHAVAWTWGKHPPVSKRCKAHPLPYPNPYVGALEQDVSHDCNEPNLGDVGDSMRGAGNVYQNNPASDCSLLVLLLHRGVGLHM